MKIIYRISDAGYKKEKPKLNIQFLTKLYEKGFEKEDEWMKNDVQKEVDKYCLNY